MLLPYGRMPLNIFEPRYLAMVEDALAAGRMFGMIQPDSRKAPTAQGPALFGVGCLGRITSFTETEDGRIILSLLGVLRFGVVQELEMRNGYRQLQVDFSHYAADLAPVSDTVDLPRKPLLASLRSYFDRQSLTADWGAIGEMDDPTLLTTLCMICPFSPSEKQALLEAETAQERASILQALLEFGMHGGETAGDDLRPS